MEPVTAALQIGATLLRSKIAQQQAYRGSGRGHATASLAQLAYLSGNRDARVIALMRGAPPPTLEEALNSIAYYSSRITTVPAQQGLAGFLNELQTIPASAFGYQNAVMSETPGPITYTYKRTFNSIYDMDFTLPDGTRPASGTSYRLPGTTRCQLFTFSTDGGHKVAPWKAITKAPRGYGRVDEQECPPLNAPPLFDFTIPGLGEPVAKTAPTIPTQLLAQINRKRWTDALSWGGFATARRGWDALLQRYRTWN